MRIAVIGAGAIGTVFAAGLAGAGHDVILLARRAVYADAVDARGGLSVEFEGRERITPCRISLEPAELAGCELAVVLVKSMHTGEAAEAMASFLPSGSPVLTLQNGLGNMEALRENLPGNPVLAGVTTCAATRLEPGRSRLVSAGETLLGPENPADPADEDHAARLAALLAEAGFPCRAVGDPRPFLWQKLLVNIAVNPLTALTGLHNGAIAASEPLRSIAAAAIAEGEAVAGALGIAVPGDGLGRLLSVCETTADNYSSMAQDMAAGRPTEIESLNGALTRLGRQAGIPTPVNDTLAALVRAKEAGGRRGCL